MNQVRNTIRTGRLSPGRSTGRPPVLTFEQEEELVTFVCSSQEAWQMSYLELALHFESWNVGQDAIRNALKRRGFSRYVARRKPPLTDEHTRLRLEWAERHFHFEFEDWCRVIWSDETYIGDGYVNKVHVTRRVSLKVLI